MATAFEYITATYGREQIPLLLAAIPAHTQVEMLIPAVFGVSQADFDRGWQTHLDQHYEIAPIKNAPILDAETANAAKFD